MRRIATYYNRAAKCTGFTLTEVVISILIVMILATGAMGYQYSSARNVKISEVQTTATRIAMLLLESWKGQQGDTTFDPVSIFSGQLTIQTSAVAPEVPDNALGIPLTSLGTYLVTANGVNYYIRLSYDPASASEPMLLNAAVTWKKDYSQGQLDGDELFVRYSTYLISY